MMRSHLSVQDYIFASWHSALIRLNNVQSALFNQFFLNKASLKINSSLKRIPVNAYRSSLFLLTFKVIVVLLLFVAEAN